VGGYTLVAADTKMPGKALGIYPGESGQNPGNRAIEFAPTSNVRSGITGY